MHARHAPGFFFLAFVFLPLAGMAAGQDDTLADRTLAAGCAGCHGTDGRPPPNSPVPVLAGQQVEQLREAMRAYRDGTRAGTVMPQIAKGYDDARVERLAHYFATHR